MQVYNVRVTFVLPDGKPYELTAVEAEILENEDYLALRPSVLAGILNEVEEKAEQSLSGFDRKR